MKNLHNYDPLTSGVVDVSLSFHEIKFSNFKRKNFEGSNVIAEHEFSRFQKIYFVFCILDEFLTQNYALSIISVFENRDIPRFNGS